MGRFAIEFDPAGYKRVAEPGLDYLIEGPELLAKFAADTDAAAARVQNFYNPPGTPWLLCRPRQFAPNWYQDARLGDHVLRSASWQWASGLTPVEYEPSRIPGTTYADNQWVSVTVPAGTASLDTRDYTAMLTAAGVTLPTGLVTIGSCAETPGGASISTGISGLTPFLQWLNYPSPNDVLVFGFAQVAVIAYRDAYWVLKALDSGGQEWELLGKRSMVGSATPPTTAPVAATGGSVVQTVGARPDVRSLLLHPLGFNEVYAVPSVGDGAAFPLRNLPDGADTPLFIEGPIWVAAMPGQLLSFQAQLVGYEEADSREPDFPVPTPWIDLTEFYKPSVAPTFNGSLLLWGTPGTTPTSTVDADNWVTAEPVGFDNSIVYGLVDELGDPWDFAGAATYQGGLFLNLVPGWKDDLDGAFLSPQVRCLEFRFPVVLEARENDPLVLVDTEFGSVEAEAFLRDPLGKRVRIELFDAGLETLSASGHDQRANYPVHILEDADNNGSYETVRVKAWLKQFTITELKAAHPTTGDPILSYQLELHGLLSRADGAWEFLPQMVDPEADPSGTVEHTFAVSSALNQSGFPIDDTAIYLAQTDAAAGTDLAQLPGTWGRTSGSVGRAVGNAWGPTWSETRLEYALRVSRKLRGWVLYENLNGLIRYHEDLLRDLERGAEYVTTATLHASHADATAASAPRQVYLSGVRLDNEEPLANIVRVSGADESQAICPQVAERHEPGISDITSPDYLGDKVVYEVHPREGVELGVLKVLCRLLVERICRRRFRRAAETEIAPWEASPAAFELGHVLQLGARGDFLVEHCSWRLLKSHATASVHRTTLTLASLPTGATEGTGTGTYPGRAEVT